MKIASDLLTITCIFLSAFTSIAQPSSEVAPDESLTVKVDQIFEEWDKTLSPGCALGVIKDGGIIYKRGYGMANLEYGISITSRSVFRIGSTSKQFTAMAILLLTEQGKLSLDDDIRQFIPELPKYDARITIRHLLYHTSGLRDYLELMNLAGRWNYDFYTDDEVLQMVSRQKNPNYSTGNQYLYSNTNYWLMSQIVLRVTGQSLCQFAHEQIFRPLGMNDTHFHDDHTMIVENRADGYAPDPDGGFRLNMTTLDMVGDGGVFTTVEDLYLWDQNFYQNILGMGGPELIEQMLIRGKLNNGEQIDYAKGLFIDEYRGLKTVSHGGAFVGFRAEMLRFPDQRLTVICLCNLSTMNPTTLARRVADIYLFGGYQESATEVEQSDDEPFPKITLTTQELRDLTGIYYNPELGTIKTIEADGTLSAEAFGVKYQLSPISHTVFQTVNTPINAELVFENTDQGYQLHVKVIDQDRKTYVKIKAVLLTARERFLYTGDYYSDELQSTYRIEVKDDKLYFTQGNAPKAEFVPRGRDEFCIGNWDVEFERDTQDLIAGFTLHTGRVKNIRFARIETEQ